MSAKTNGRQFIVCSARTAEEMKRKVDQLFSEMKYVVFSWKSGDTSTTLQKALIHIWLLKWAAFALSKVEDDVTKAEVEGMKRSVKSRYYHETGAAWMVEEIFDPLAPKKRRTEYTSIADWSPGECFMVMEWMQLKAAEQGLILEAEGEFERNKKQGTQ